jgi:hypothetical protein
VLGLPQTSRDVGERPNAVFYGIWCVWKDDIRRQKTLCWCPGPDSNRHGVASEGFSYSLQLSLLSRLQWQLIWSLDFLFAVRSVRWTPVSV